jgi:FkbM family methyltransferase
MVSTMRGEYNEQQLRIMCKDLNLSGKTMVEIGSYAGESTVVFAEVCKKVYAVDPWLIDMSLADGNTEGESLLMGSDVETAFDEKTKNFPNIVKIKAFDQDVINTFENESLDYVYIDALHTEVEMRRQIKAWMPKIKKGSFLGGHDFNAKFPGIMKAVTEELGYPDRLYNDAGVSWAKFKIEDRPIHFIHTGGNWTYQYQLAVDTAKRTQNGKVIVHTPKNLPKFKALQDKPEHFKLAHLKDYLTYKILFEQGGLCLDLDTVSLSDVTGLIGEKEMMIPLDASIPCEVPYNSAILEAKKGSPVVKEALDEAEKILNGKDMKWGDTGPILISKIVKKYRDKVIVPPFAVCGGFKNSFNGLPVDSFVKVIHFYSFSSGQNFLDINEDYVAHSNMPVAKAIRNILSPKTFVEIGTNTFETLDYLADEGWRGLMVEAVPEYFNKLVQKPEIIYENVAIGEKTGTKTFYYLSEETITKNNLPDWARGIGSFEIHPLVVSNHWEQLLTKIEVPVMTIKKLLKKHHIERIDFLKTDTEGYDAKILLGMDLKNVDKIQFEHKYFSPEETRRVREKLAGYNIIYQGDNTVATKKNQGYRFHILGLGHLPVSEEYVACAYTQKIYKLCKMLMAAGCEVYLYGIEGSDAPCTEFVQVCSLKDVRDAFGEGDNRFALGYDWHHKMFKHDWNMPATEATKTFYKNAIVEINKRKQEDDFIFATAGNWHKPITDAVNLFLTCEPGIGYTGAYSRFKAFESSYMQNFFYGRFGGKDSMNGNNYDVVIPNYFDITDFDFQPKKKDYFLYIGRMINRKGILTAIETCKKLGVKLVLAGQGGRVENGIFYGEDFSAPYVNMQYVGFADKEKRNKLMGHAKATFLATDYLEPFGGTSIESLFCGTPVITTNYGCFPETIPHGVVGYRCQTLDQFVWAAKNIDKISPAKCREYAEKNYSIERVSEMYQEWFDSLYHLYLSTKNPDGEGWYYVDENRKNLNWLNKY